MKRLHFFIGLILFLIQSPIIKAQDYTHAEGFVWDSLSKMVFNLSIQPQWIEDGSGLTYKSSSESGDEYFLVDWSGQKGKINIQAIVKALEKLTGEKNIEFQSLNNLQFRSKNILSLKYKENSYEVDLKQISLKQEEKTTQSKRRDLSVSPDKKYEVYTYQNNLFLKNRQNNEVIQLSTDGTPLYSYGSSYGWDYVMKGENAEPQPSLTVKWSPDSKKILTQIMDATRARKMYLLDWSQDSLYRPELISYFRGSPGDTNVVSYIPVIYDVQTAEMTKINLEPIPHFMDDLQGYGSTWTQDSQWIYSAFNRRGYKQKDYLKINPKNGKVEVLYSDHSETNIDYLSRFRYIDELNLALLTSEKSGWKQLYSLDFGSGKLSTVTKGDFVVKDIQAIDIKNKTIYFTASGKEPGVNPYYDLLYKIGFDGNNLHLLTPEPMNHEVYISPDFKYFADNISTAINPTRIVLRDTQSGKIISELESAHIEKLSNLGWKPPQLFTAIAQDGKTEIHGALWKPTHFDPEKRYPIVDYTYTGPHMNVFPNTFRKGIYGLYNSAQALAELGFIVMQVDGMGTAGRSKAFHNVSYKNMGRNLLDHTLAIQQLGQKYTWIDTDRVGIFGHSAGGYDAAHALLEFNQTYKVAISEAADHDWRMEKAWWPEMYAGWPVDETYHEQSNITLAPKLQGKLLLIHGGLDENVNPSATFKLSEALIKANKYFDLLIIPSARHSFPKEYLPYVMKKRWMFFVQNLKNSN